MTIILGICCEDKGHYTAVTKVVDEHVTEHVDWVVDILDHCRKWQGRHEDEPYYKYHKGDYRGPKLHGWIKGKRKVHDADQWRETLLLFVQANPRPDIVVLVRDVDRDECRLEGIQQARESSEWPFQIVYAAAHPEVEAWRISGFVPQNEREERLLEALTKELKFDPIKQQDKLTSKPNDAPTDTKIILARLCGKNEERSDRCLDDRSLLRERGQANGFAAFLDQVEKHILPIFQNGKPGSLTLNAPCGIVK
ncbi:MAG TPA: hypothetical protein PK156_02490 [Polyangium sp.]|nr:hypothetical protein [Polyangium sp.]